MQPLNLLPPQLFHQPLSVLFLAPGAIAAADGEPAALVSRSNRQLRRALDAAAAEYEMAATAAAAQQQQGGSGGNGSGKRRAEQQEQQHAAAGGGATPHAADGRAGSQLLVRGARGVNALYLQLLAAAWCGADGGAAVDVPLLLAPAPFAGAALCPCTLRELPNTAAAAAAAAPKGGLLARRSLGTQQQQQQPHHYAELCAPGDADASTGSAVGSVGAGGSGSGSSGSGAVIAPWVLARLAALLAETQHSGFELFAEPEPGSASLNPAAEIVAGARWAAAAAAAEGRGSEESDGAFSPAERAAWAESARRLAGRFVRQLRLDGDTGLFSVRLGAA